METWAVAAGGFVGEVEGRGPEPVGIRVRVEAQALGQAPLGQAQTTQTENLTTHLA